MIFCFTFPKVIDTLLDMPIYMREELTVYIITNGILEKQHTEFCQQIVKKAILID